VTFSRYINVIDAAVVRAAPALRHALKDLSHIVTPRNHLVEFTVSKHPLWISNGSYVSVELHGTAVMASFIPPRVSASDTSYQVSEKRARYGRIHQFTADGAKRMAREIVAYLALAQAPDRDFAGAS
jgi:hypothetical protein